MYQKKLTIGITSYNNLPFLNALIYEIDSQVKYTKILKEIDIFLCDDASNDPQYPLFLKSLPSYIKILINDLNHGNPSFSRNRIIEAANTEFILFIDGDDTFVGKIIDLLDELMENKADLIVSRVVRVKRDGLKSRSLFMYTDRLFSGIQFSQNDVRKLTVHQAGIWSIYRLEFLIEHNLRYETTLRYEDNFFMTAIHLKNPKIYLLKMQYYGWRVNYRSFSFSPKTTNNRLLIYKEILNRLAQNPNQEIAPYLYYSIWNLTFVNIARGYPRLKYQERYDYFKKLREISLEYRHLIKKWGKSIDINYVDYYTRFCIKTNINSFLLLNLIRFLRILFSKATLKMCFMQLSKIFMLFPINNKKIFMTSFYGAFNDNTKYLFYEMRKNPEFNDKKIIFAVKNPELYQHNKSFINFNNKLLFFYHHYTAKSIYFNSWYDPIIAKRKGQIWTQLWHGIPYKKIDRDVVTYKQTYSSKNRESRNAAIDKWDIIQSVNAYNTEIFKKIFPNVTIIEREYQKTNWLINNRNNEKLITKLKINHQLLKKTILFAPTYRPYKFYIDLFKIAQLVDWNVYGELIIHLHPLMNYEFVNEYINDLYNIRIIHKVEDIQELILITDGVITDVSSIKYDYETLKKEVIIYFEDAFLYNAFHGVYETNILQEVT